MRIDEIEPGQRVFIDSPIFLYHFAGVSAECRQLLERCEVGDVRGITSVIVVAEVTHRLMLAEAVSKGLVSGANVTRKLRERPDVVRALDLYQQRVEQIPGMGIEVLPADFALLVRSGGVRRRHGLLTNDSTAVAAADAESIEAIATADRDFQRLPDLKIYSPADMEESR